MNIRFLRPLPIGHAMELLLTVDPSITAWHIARRTDALFPENPLDFTGSVITHAWEGIASAIPQEWHLLDDQDVARATTYYYRAYGYDGAAWQSSPLRSASAAATLTERCADPFLVVRDRLHLGLEDAVVAARLHPASGRIPVLTAPPQADAATWPLVTMHLDAYTASERFIGEHLDDHLDAHDDWWETEGWLARLEISIIGWSQNPDERLALRHELNRIILGNLPVLAAHGVLTPDWRQQDQEDFSTFSAPVYQAVGTLSCLTPNGLAWTQPAITAITAEALTTTL